jgi:hypothetical protein
MQKSFSIAAILSTAALVILASANPSEAGPCMFGKDKGITPRNSGDSPSLPSTRLNTNDVDTNDNHLGILSIAMAAGAGLVVAGIVYKVRRAGQEADAMIAQIPQEEALEATSFPHSISSDTLGSSTSEQKMADSTTERDLTLVG